MCMYKSLNIDIQHIDKDIDIYFHLHDPTPVMATRRGSARSRLSISEYCRNEMSECLSSRRSMIWIRNKAC